MGVLYNCTDADHECICLRWFMLSLYVFAFSNALLFFDFVVDFIAIYWHWEPNVVLYIRSIILQSHLYSFSWILTALSAVWISSRSYYFGLFTRDVFWISVIGVAITICSLFVKGISTGSNFYLPVLFNLMFFIGFSFFICGVVANAILSIRYNNKDDDSLTKMFHIAISGTAMMFLISILSMFVSYRDAGEIVSDVHSFFAHLFVGTHYILLICYTQILSIMYLHFLYQFDRDRLMNIVNYLIMVFIVAMFAVLIVPVICVVYNSSSGLEEQQFLDKQFLDIISIYTSVVMWVILLSTITAFHYVVNFRYGLFRFNNVDEMSIAFSFKLFFIGMFLTLVYHKFITAWHVLSDVILFSLTIIFLNFFRNMLKNYNYEISKCNKFYLLGLYLYGTGAVIYIFINWFALMLHSELLSSYAINIIFSASSFMSFLGASLYIISLLYTFNTEKVRDNISLNEFTKSVT